MHGRQVRTGGLLAAVFTATVAQARHQQSRTFTAVYCAAVAEVNLDS